jgi:hypothetical protein
MVTSTQWPKRMEMGLTWHFFSVQESRAGQALMELGR